MQVKFSNPYWSQRLKVEFLQRAIAIHSFLYYELSQPVLTDMSYDELAQQLVREQSKLSEQEFEQTQYFYCMHDFDGTTGFDIYARLTEEDRERVSAIGFTIVRAHEKGSGRDARKRRD